MEYKMVPKKRTTNFREDETKLLIQLWGSPTVQNKLYLTHRKAPVMRLIASKMEKYGFYRTPDEIKTRIRNLKCLYHRIKKSTSTGTGIGTVDPDWPHYKAMDDILSKKNALRQNLVYNHNLLSEVNAEVKEEIEDIEVNDDGDTSNSNGSDDEFEETASLMPSTITPLIIEEEEPEKSEPVKIAPKTVLQPPPMPRIQIAQNLLSTTAPSAIPSRGPTAGNMSNVRLPQVHTFQTTSGVVHQTPTTGNIRGNVPFPLLILNGMQPGQNPANGLCQNKGTVGSTNSGTINGVLNNGNFNAEVATTLKDLVMLQKESLELKKEQLALEREKLELERAVGAQLLAIVPGFSEIFQRCRNDMIPEEVDSKSFAEHPTYGTPGKSADSTAKRSTDSTIFAPKAKIFKEALVNDIKKYMQGDQMENSTQTASTKERT